MCQYNSAITVYQCGAVEHVERKERDCERKHCINSKKHPWNCIRKSFFEWLKDILAYSTLSTEHGPACRDYHDITFSFANVPTGKCPKKDCNFLQSQEDEGFKEAVKTIREEVVERINEQETAEQDAASTKQLRDEPM